MQYSFGGVNKNKAKQQGQLNSTSSAYPSTKRLLAMYGEGSLYAALPLHMQRGCFQIRTHDQPVNKAQLYCCTGLPLMIVKF